MITIFNPLQDDFENRYDVNGDGNPVGYVIPSMEFMDFENEAMAEHCMKHLAKKIVFARGVRKNFDHDYEEALKEIVV